MFNKFMNSLIFLACLAVNVLIVAGVSQYENAADKAPIVYDNAVITGQDGKLYACPTVAEQQEAAWSCSTDTECDQQYKAFFGVEPWECGDQS